MNNFFFVFINKSFFLFLIIFSSHASSVLSEPGVSVFMYHRFDENKYPSTNVSEEQFLSHIHYILNNDIKIVKLHEIIEVLNSNGVFDEKAVAFSVDDAYSSFYNIAWPIFRDNNIPVTLFISTDIIDKKTNGYMSWEEINQFISEGGDVGQHTSTHLHMPLNKVSEVKKDLIDSHKSWEKNVGFIPTLFAYPYGETSNSIIEILKEYGISHAFGQHSGVISSFDNHYYLPRFSLNQRFGETDRFEFALKAHSLDIKDLTPNDMYLTINKRPSIEFSVINDLKGNSIECFSNPGNKWNKQNVVNITKDRVQVQLIEDYDVGRARLNCTIRINENWYWFGYQFLVK